jgi:hypothetical protein
MSRLDASEPRNGDFVAYVERIEREQLARAMQPHRMTQLPPSGKVGGDGAEQPLSAAEAQRVVDLLKAKVKSTGAPLGASIGVVAGALLIAFGLLANGGVFLVLLGAVLLWQNLRKIGAARRTAGPAQQVDAVFGRGAPRAAADRRS